MNRHTNYFSNIPVCPRAKFITIWATIELGIQNSFSYKYLLIHIIDFTYLRCIQLQFIELHYAVSFIFLFTV
jgi:hypothetical protein